MYSLTSYTYDLPEELIAQHPKKDRADSRLMVLDGNTGETTHRDFRDIGDYLHPSDVLVVNNTEVVPGRLFGKKDTGGKAEILILNYSESAADNGRRTFDCLVKSSKRPKPGTSIYFEDDLQAEVIENKGEIQTLRFTSEESFETVLYRIGKTPLPPYIKRQTDEESTDRSTYQTVYAKRKGAIAAPTAGLHFTDALLAELREKGIKIVEITLHVGYGTFLPVRTDDIRRHNIHSEWFSIGESAADIINRSKSEKSRIIAVGTTSVRTLEFCADENGNVIPGVGNCDLYIYPGYRFKVVDAMITNFHLPESTLLMLVSAFAGHRNILNAYRQAVEQRYRFYSYGDAMMIHRTDER